MALNTFAVLASGRSSCMSGSELYMVPRPDSLIKEKGWTQLVKAIKTPLASRRHEGFELGLAPLARLHHPCALCTCARVVPRSLLHRTITDNHHILIRRISSTQRWLDRGPKAHSRSSNTTQPQHHPAPAVLCDVHRSHGRMRSSRRATDTARSKGQEEADPTTPPTPGSQPEVNDLAFRPSLCCADLPWW